MIVNKPKVYIDGQAGTTGLEIYARLSKRKDIELIQIDENLRKNPLERKKLMNQADLVFLCLPDQASKEAMTLITNPQTKVIDASTAHRTNENWVYGMSELSLEHKQKIQSHHFVANPGCHATGFIMSVYPLIQSQIISPSTILSCFSLTGYSGGGKKMIQQYEQEKKHELYAPRIYGLNQNHKHLAEMKKICGLEHEPIFNPIVDDYYRGMATTITIDGHDKKEVYDILSSWYKDSPLISVYMQEEGMISANIKEQTDSLDIIVYGNNTRVCVTCLFDNLGKGACGAAIQNMNLMLGFDELEGLHI